MDSAQFDRIAKDLANPSSRRTAMKAVAAGALGLALTRVAPSGADARKCIRNGKRCQRDGQCCSGECRRDVCRRDRDDD